MAADPTPDRVLRSIRRIIRQVSSYSRHLSDETGLTVPQVLCLRAVRDLEGSDVTVAAVADAVQLSRSTVSAIVDRLVRAGLLHRDRSEVDRRRVALSLTERGAARLDDVPGPLQDEFVARFRALPLEEQERLSAALERIVALMDAEGLDAAPVLTPGAMVTPR